MENVCPEQYNYYYQIGHLNGRRKKGELSDEMILFSFIIDIRSIFDVKSEKGLIRHLNFFYLKFAWTIDQCVQIIPTYNIKHT